MQCGCEECYGDGGKEYRTAENGARRKSWEKRARVEAAWRILLPYFKDVQDRAVSFREVWAVRRILTVNLPDAKERCAETALHAFLICTAVAALLPSVRCFFSYASVIRRLSAAGAFSFAGALYRNPKI